MNPSKFFFFKLEFFTFSSSYIVHKDVKQSTRLIVLAPWDRFQLVRINDRRVTTERPYRRIMSRFSEEELTPPISFFFSKMQILSILQWLHYEHGH